MEHTSPFIYRRLELFNHGQQSDYYWDIPMFTLLVDDNDTEAYVQLLVNFSKKVWSFDRPHVIRNPVRESKKDQFYVASIEEAQEKFAQFLKENAERTLWPCENEREVNSAKRNVACDQIYSIFDQTVLKKVNGTWLSYPMAGFPPVPEFIYLNTATGKYFEGQSSAPFLVRWPGNQNLEIEQLVGSGTCIITVESNIPDALWSIDGKTWLSVATSLRVNPGNYEVQFSEMSNYFTPESQQIQVSTNKTVYVNYELLYNINFVTNENETYVREIGSLEWVSMPCIISVKAGRHSFEFSKIEHWNSPEIVDLNVDNNLTYEARYEKIYYVITVESNVIGARATLQNETKNLPAKFAVPYGKYTLIFEDIPGYITPSNITIIADSNKVIKAEYGAYALDIRPNLSGGFCRIGTNSSFPLPSRQLLRGGVYTLTFTPPAGCKVDPEKMEIELKEDTILHVNFVSV